MSVRRSVSATLLASALLVMTTAPGRVEGQRVVPTGLSSRNQTSFRAGSVAVMPLVAPAVAIWPPSRLAFGDVHVARGAHLPAPPPDRWLGRDKVRHAGSAAAIQIMGYGLLRLAGASRGASFAGASLGTLAASIGKEVHDARYGGDPSARDLAWDGVGMLLGSGVVHVADPP